MYESYTKQALPEKQYNVTLEEYSELCNMYLGINESEDCIATRE